MDIQKTVSEYLQLQEKSKEIEKRMKALKAEIKPWVEEHGVADSNGSQKVEFSNGDRVELVARSTVKMDEELAVKLFKNLDLDECYDEVISYIINENMVEEKVRDGSISNQQLRDITTVKVTKALYVKGAKAK